MIEVVSAGRTEDAVEENLSFMELIRNTNNRITELSSQLNMIGRELSANQQSTTGLWHEITQIKKNINALRESFFKILSDHEHDCLAFQKAKQRALADSSGVVVREDPSAVFNLQQAVNPVRPANDTSGEGSNVKIPRVAIIVALILGALLVGGGIVIGAAWSGGPAKAGEVIRELSGDDK